MTRTFNHQPSVHYPAPMASTSHSMPGSLNPPSSVPLAETRLEAELTGWWLSLSWPVRQRKCFKNSKREGIWHACLSDSIRRLAREVHL